MKIPLKRKFGIAEQVYNKLINRATTEKANYHNPNRISLIRTKRLPPFTKINYNINNHITESFTSLEFKEDRQSVKELCLNLNKSEIYDCKLNTLLNLFIIKENIEIIKIILDNSEINLNFKDEKGRTNLHLAAKSGNLDVIEILIESGADIYALDNNNNSVLHYAARKNKLSNFMLFLKYGLNMDTPNINNATPLHLSISNHAHDITNFLIEQHLIDVNSPVQKGKFFLTPLHLAVMSKNLTAVKSLLKRNDLNINKTLRGHFSNKECDYTALKCAVISGYSEIIEALLEHREINLEEIQTLLSSKKWLYALDADINNYNLLHSKLKYLENPENNNLPNNKFCSIIKKNISTQLSV